MLQNISILFSLSVRVRFKPSTTYKLVKPKFAWHTVSMDLIGPLPPSTTGVKYIIVAIDHLTKWVEARAVKDLGARTVAKFVQEQIIHSTAALSSY